MKKNKKLSFILTVILVLALLIGGYLFRDGENTPIDDPADTSERYETVDTEKPEDPETDPAETEGGDTTEAPEETERTIDKNGSYTSKEDVALYIHTYGHLPSNFITKDEAEALGWTGGGLDKYAKGKCIGGDRFGNNEGLLPKKSGRTYTECDIDTLGKSSRGAKRIVFSNDGLIYYTDDHYESFELLYGNPD